MGGAMGVSGVAWGYERVYCGGRVLGPTGFLSVVGVVLTLVLLSLRWWIRPGSSVSLPATCHQQRTWLDVGDTVHQLALYMLLCC
jgi:hypothetical protein